MENILDMRIYELAKTNLLNNRIINCLRKITINGTLSLRYIVMLNKDQLMKIKGFGETSLKELSAFLDQYGLRIGMTEEDIEDYEGRNSYNNNNMLTSINWNMITHDLIVSVATQVYHENMQLPKSERQTVKMCSIESARYVKFLIDELRKEIIEAFE